MSKFCVSIFNEKERIINSQIFNNTSIEDLQKEIQHMLYEFTFDKPLPHNKNPGCTLVQEISKDNIKWLYFTVEKRNKIVKYFVILERYAVK